MSGSKWRMCTLQTSFFTQLQLCNSVPAPICGRGSDHFIYASSGCCSCISIAAVLQILGVRGFNRSQPNSPFLTAKTEPCAYHTISSSCYVSTTAPSHSVQHGHIVIALSSVTSIPNAVFSSFPNSAVSTHDSTVISCSPKCSSFSGLGHSRPYLCLPLE